MVVEVERGRDGANAAVPVLAGGAGISVLSSQAGLESDRVLEPSPWRQPSSSSLPSWCSGRRRRTFRGGRMSETRSSVHSVLSSVLINVIGIVGHGSQLGRGHRQWTRRQDCCSFRHPNRHADRRCTRTRTHANFRAFRLRGGSGSALQGRIVHCRAVGPGNRPSESQQSLPP
jgi:hypothetical protein